MKVRHRGSKNQEGTNNYWTSFTDIMTTVCLVFFFFMLILMTSFYTKYSKMKVYYEKKLSEIQVISDRLDDIVYNRIDLYEDIENELKPILNDRVNFNKELGKLEISTEILFKTNSKTLSKQGVKIAEDIYIGFLSLLEKEKYRGKIECIEIRGHTDCVGDGVNNRSLSTERAANFLNAMLKDKGIGNDNEYGRYFKASGMSKYDPKAGDSISEQSDEEKEQNRRIEIYIIIGEDDIAEEIKRFVDEQKESEHIN